MCFFKGKAKLFTFLSSVEVSGSWSKGSGAPLNTLFQFLKCSVAPEDKQSAAIFRYDIFNTMITNQSLITVYALFKQINLVSIEKGKWWKCAYQVVVGFTDGCGIETFGRAVKSSRFRGHLFVCKDTVLIRGHCGSRADRVYIFITLHSKLALTRPFNLSDIITWKPACLAVEGSFPPTPFFGASNIDDVTLTERKLILIGLLEVEASFNH